MRVILFRGKRRDNGKWWYGSYLFLHTKPMDWTGMRVGKAEDVHFIIDETDLNYAVDPATIGQYTGLSDKNGTQIFEGDILQTGTIKGNVVWSEKRSEYYLLWKDYGKRCDVLKSPNLASFTIGRDVEVIGNIHDNPELLKGDIDA